MSDFMSSSEQEEIPTDPLEFFIAPHKTYEFQFKSEDQEAILLNAVLLNKSEKEFNIYLEYNNFIEEKPLTDKVLLTKFKPGELVKQIEIILYPSMKPKFINEGDVNVKITGQLGPEGSFSSLEEEEYYDKEDD